jgi:toxin ParE1/3/4
VKLKSSKQAKADLAALRAWFKEKNPQVGMRIAARIKDKIAHLKQHPRMGREVAGRPGVRELVVDAYVVSYVLEDDTILLVRIWHGAQDRQSAG